MAQKDKTYLRFEGGSSSNYGQTQGGVITNATGTFVFTIFVRLLEWPVATAPICQQATDGGPGSKTITWGLWYYADEFAKTSSNGRLITDDSACLGVQFSLTTGPSTSVVIPLTASGVPAKLGNIYQIQFVQKYNSGDSKTYTAVFVDGVSRYQTNWTGQLEEGSQGDVLRVGHPAILPFDFTGNGQVEEPTCMDIIQFMYENDRTVSITSGTIDAPDSALDPWERLVVDASAANGQAFTLEEGTGSPSGTQWTGPDWADETKVDPQIDEDAGSIAWTFENIFGYSEGEEDAYPQPVFAPIASRSDPTAGELRLRLLPKVWAEHGALRQGASYPEVYQDWTNPDWGLSASSAQIAIGDESVIATATSAGNSYGHVDDHGGATEEGQGIWRRVWYYDKGGTSSDLIQRIQWTGGTLLWVGVLFSQSLTHYATQAGGSIAVSSVARSTGWHEWLIYTERGVIGNEKCRIYLDGQLVRSLDQADASDNAYIPGTRIQCATAADQFHVDWWAHNIQLGNTPTDFQGLVAPTATVVLPDSQPTGNVVSFDSVTIVDEDAGSSSMEVGTLTYEFQHSTNGGSSFGSWTALTNGNLQALTPAGGGQDVIRVRVTLDSGCDDMATPAVRSITIAYTSGIIPRIIHHRRQMAGVC